MVFKGYTKRDTSIIKGFGILCIVLHNYFHWRPPSPGENEFDFLSERVTAFFTLLGEHPNEFINLIFSYLGHYGVQLFIFISGFGLAISMINRPRTWESFIVTRLKRLYPLLLVGILFFILSYMEIFAKPIGFYEKKELVYKLLLIHTLVPDSGLSVCGPWWFFGLVFQLYLLFPYLNRLIGKWGWKAFAVICVVSYAMIFLLRSVCLQHNVNIMMNAPGHLPEFCLGILLAYSKDKKINALWLILALAVFSLGNLYEVFYPFTFLSLTVVAVFAYQGLKSIPVKKTFLSCPLAYFGGISMALFATHAVFREQIHRISWNYGYGALWNFETCVIYFLIAWGVAVSAKVLYDFIESWLDKIAIPENRLTHILGIIGQLAVLASFVYIIVKFY